MLSCVDCGREIHRPPNKRGRKPKRCDACRAVERNNKANRSRARKRQEQPQPVEEREPPPIEWSQEGAAYYAGCEASDWWPRLTKEEVEIVRGIAYLRSQLERAGDAAPPSLWNAWEKQLAHLDARVQRHATVAVYEQDDRPDNVVDLEERFG